MVKDRFEVVVSEPTPPRQITLSAAAKVGGVKLVVPEVVLIIGRASRGQEPKRGAAKAMKGFVGEDGVGLEVEDNRFDALRGKYALREGQDRVLRLGEGSGHVGMAMVVVGRRVGGE